LFVLWCWHFLQCSSQPVQLFPDQGLENEVIIPGESVIYALDGLEPNSHYEVRISYPATSPTEFSISFVNQVEFKTSRQLLNIEKLMFQTDEEAKVVGFAKTTENYLVKVSATYSGVSTIAGADKRPVVYNIVLETLFFGIPYDSVFIASGVAVAVIVIFGAILPQILPLLHAIKGHDKHN